MEIWGRCADCSRWFYCPTAERHEAWACPVCASEPIAIENRAPRVPARAIGVVEMEASAAG